MGKDLTALFGPRPRRSRRAAVARTVAVGTVDLLVSSVVGWLVHRSTTVDVVLIVAVIAALAAAAVYARWPRRSGRHQR